MLRKTLLTLSGFAVLLCTQASNLDLQSRVNLNRARMSNDGLIHNTLPNRSNKEVARKAASGFYPSRNNNTLNAFVKIADGFSVEDLENEGFVVNTCKGRIAIVTLNVDSVDHYAAKECVAKLTVEKPVKAEMDLARAEAGVDIIQEGKNFSMPYTGKGVLAAVIDQGIDPNHISFIDEDGENRVKFLTYFDGTATSSGYPKAQYYGDNIVFEDDNGNIQNYPTIDKFYTDEAEAYHGTHTLNILGGGYKGNISVVENGRTVQKPNPYYGVAPETDLAVSCGVLSDACVAMGLAELLSYAEYRRAIDGMPSVVSISLGSADGPHDPGAPMNEYLEYCGEESIIVVAAGNEGDLKIALNKKISENDPSLKSLIYPYGYRYESEFGKPSQDNTYYRNGVVMVYSEDNTPFTIQGFVMTGEPGNYRRRSNFNISGADGNYYLSDSKYYNYVGGSVNSTIQRYFDGYVGGGTMLDPELGRYYGAFDYYLVTNPETGINADGSEAVIIGFEIITEKGVRIDCFCDGMNTWMSDYGIEGYDDGSTDGTISDMAVGNNILVVGAYTTRNEWTALDGVKYVYDVEDGFDMGGIGTYSSYGTLADGRTLPHVCAPGTAIMSAVSTPWIDSYFAGYESYIPMNTTAKVSINGSNYYWKPETGTSMSTPFVAGGIALWLEADPNLTINDVFDIIEKTSVKDEKVKGGNPAQWGAGKFDAVAGLKEVIARAEAGVDKVESEGRNNRLILTQSGRGLFSLFVGGATNLEVKVHSLSGNCVYDSLLKGNQAEVDLSGLSSGVYVINVNGHSRKIIL